MCAGSCRLAPDIDDVGARCHQLEPEGDRALGVEVAARFAERVGRDVDDAHDHGPAEVRDPPHDRAVVPGA